jgi:hypothetical protein
MHRHHPSQSRRSDQIEEGYYSLVLARGGWPVPCRIERTDDGQQWFAVIDGIVRPANPDPWYAEGIVNIHEHGLRISQQEYDWRIETKQWAVENDPSHPALSPRRRIEIRKLRPLQPRTPIPWTPINSRTPP